MFDPKDPSQIEKLQRMARYVAIKRGHADLAEDFAQEAVIAKLRWPGQTIEQALSNFLRKEQGDPSTPCGRIRRSSRSREIRLDAPIEREDEGSSLNHERVGSAELDPEPVREPGRYLGLFEGREKSLYEMRFVEEMSTDQIARYFGVARNTISEWLSPIKQKLRGAQMKEQIEEKLEEDPNFTRLEIAWIKL